MHVSIDGIAVKAAGDDETDMAGVVTDGQDLTNAIEYFIPLRSGASGVFGAASSLCSNGVGTCSDSGPGFGYSDASSLAMNIYFDLDGVAESQSASLSFQFDDLDLSPYNDPTGFYESITLSYWDWNGVGYDLQSLTGGTVITAAIDSPADVPVKTANQNLVAWDLDLAAIAALNASATANDGFWIQLGFGSLYEPCSSMSMSYESTSYAYVSDAYGGAGGGGGGYYDCKVRNTPEYLTAELKVTAVPVPASVWLFGTALIGFISIARRTRVS